MSEPATPGTGDELAMMFQVGVKELKGAMGAIEAMAKKVPNDLSSGDAPMALLRKEDGFSLIASHDYFVAEVPLGSVSIVGDDDGAWPAWDGESALADDNLVGFAAAGMLQSLLAKLAKVKEISCTLSPGRKKLGIEADGEKEYIVDLATTRKIVSGFKTITAEMPVATLTAEQFEWVCSAITALSRIVKESAMQPGYGNVCICAFPSESRSLQLSGNSDSDGYSVIFDTVIASDSDFTALIPKNISEAFSTFITKLGPPDGDVEMRITPGDDGKTAAMAFIAESFSFSTICSLNEFPFKALGNISKLAHEPYCSYAVAKDELKKCVDRVAIFAADPNATTDVSVLDGGVVEIVQHKALMSRESNAREVLSEGTLGDFPEDCAKVSTSVKTSPLKSVIAVVTGRGDTTLALCKPTRNGAPPRMALLSNDGMSECTAVLLGVKGR